MRSKKPLIALALCIIALGAGNTCYALAADENIQQRGMSARTFSELLVDGSSIATEEIRTRLKDNTAKKDEVVLFLTDYQYSDRQDKLASDLMGFIINNQDNLTDSDLSSIRWKKQVTCVVQNIINAREDAKKVKDISEKKLDDLLLSAAHSWSGEDKKAHTKELERRLPDLIQSSDPKDFMKFLEYTGNYDWDLKGRSDVKNHFIQIFSNATIDQKRILANSYTIPEALKDAARKQFFIDHPSEWDHHFMPKPSSNCIFFEDVKDVQGYREEFQRRLNLNGLDLKQLGVVIQRGLREKLLDEDGVRKAKERYDELLEDANQETLEELGGYFLGEYGLNRLWHKLRQKSHEVVDQEKKFVSDIDESLTQRKKKKVWEQRSRWEKSVGVNPDQDTDQEDEGVSQQTVGAQDFINELGDVFSDPKVMRMAKSMGFSEDILEYLADSLQYSLNNATQEDSWGDSSYLDKVDFQSMIANVHEFQRNTPKILLLKNIMFDYMNQVLDARFSEIDPSDLKEALSGAFEEMDPSTRAAFKKMMMIHGRYIRTSKTKATKAKKREDSFPFLKKILPLFEIKPQAKPGRGRVSEK